MKIELQNTMLSGQRTGRTINCHEDDGTEILMANVSTTTSPDGVVSLTVEHHSHLWAGGQGSTHQGQSEQEAAEALIDAFLKARSAAEGETQPA